MPPGCPALVLLTYVLAELFASAAAPVEAEWGLVPKELYDKHGTFEVAGRIAELSVANHFAPERMFSGDLNIEANGAIAATVTVLSRDDAPVCNAPFAMSLTVAAGTSHADFDAALQHDACGGCAER